LPAGPRRVAGLPPGEARLELVDGRSERPPLLLRHAPRGRGLAVLLPAVRRPEHREPVAAAADVNDVAVLVLEGEVRHQTDGPDGRLARGDAEVRLERVGRRQPGTRELRPRLTGALA